MNTLVEMTKTKLRTKNSFVPMTDAEREEAAKTSLTIFNGQSEEQADTIIAQAKKELADAESVSGASTAPPVPEVLVPPVAVEEKPVDVQQALSVPELKDGVVAQLRADNSAKSVREAKKSLRFAGMLPKEAQDFIDCVLQENQATEPMKVETTTATAASSPIVATTGAAETATEAIADAIAETVSATAPEPKPRADEGLFDIFTLYDEENNEHRERHRKIVEYNGFALLRGHFSAAENEKQEACLRTCGHYDIGVVKKDGDASEAYWPSRNTTDVYEQKWLRQAEVLKAQLDYAEALDADWLDIQPLDEELSPVPAFDKNWLPVSTQPWIVDVSERMSVPLDFAAICAICSLAGATGRRVFVYPKANDKEWKESICLSGAVVASSGRTKTPTWKAFMNPVIEVEKDWEREQKRQDATYEEAMKVWLTIQKENKEAKKAAADGTPVLNLIPEPQEPKKSKRRIMLNDSTPEKMHDIMRENPQGVFYYRDELSGWVAEMDMQGREGQRALFLAAMNGDDYHSVDRIGREGGQAIMCATVFGSFQPHLLVMFLNEARNIADGTIPRFHLLVWPDEINIPRVDKPANDFAKNQYRAVVRAIAALESESLSLHFAPEAQQLFDEFMDENDGKISRERDSGKRSHLAKYRGALPKIAALFQLVDMVANRPLIPSSMVNLESSETNTTMVPAQLTGNYQIDAQHFQMARSFLSYLEAHMHRVYDSKQEGLGRLKCRLVEHIKDGTLRDEMTANEIHHKDWAGLSRKATSAESIEAALEEMAERGWVRLVPVKPGTPGRPRRRWEVNPEARK